MNYAVKYTIMPHFDPLAMLPAACFWIIEFCANYHRMAREAVKRTQNRAEARRPCPRPGMPMCRVAKPHVRAKMDLPVPRAVPRAHVVSEPGASRRENIENHNAAVIECSM